MSYFFETDFRNDYEAMQSDREYRDMIDEQRYRDSEINYGIERGGLWIDDPNYCPDCNNRIEPVAAKPAGREQRRTQEAA
jgi:hypothetical protein